MKTHNPVFPLFLASVLSSTVLPQRGLAQNPIIFADVPDMSMIRVGDTYYMSSTTMHMSRCVPIMKSKDLVNWEIVNYAYDILDDVDVLNLENGSNAYGRGSWASCIRYYNSTYYVSTFSSTTGKTYIYSTKDIETGPWKKNSFSPSFHDHTLFFDDDGRVYIIYGNIKLTLVELNADLSGVKTGGVNQVIIENVSAPSGPDSRLGEGSQLFRVNDKLYLFNITWPKGGMRTVVIHRADRITGPWEGRLIFQNLGVAQGGMVDTLFVQARNTLTQRTFGPVCSGSTVIDITNMKEGDFAGLALLQRKFGLVGVKYSNGAKSIVMVSAQTGKEVEILSVPLTQKTAYLKAECNFRDLTDVANFFYSLDGKTWTLIGSQLKMEYSMPHFMGYRFGLFNYATKTPGGYVDFDRFRIDKEISVSK